MENKNNVYIVGELVEVKDYRIIQKNDNEFVAATIIVKSNIGESELLTECRTIVSKMTKKGTINKTYNSIYNIKDMVGQRVVISSASLDSNRFWSSNTNQLVNTTKVSFRLIRLARPSEKEDKASFEYSGFIVKPLHEVNDKEGNLIRYEIAMAQANYNNDNMQIVNFTVEKENAKAVQVISQYYDTGVTVSVHGICKTIVTQITKTEDVAFGDPITKTYNNTDKRFVIVGGSSVLTGEEAYSPEDIERLASAYKAEGAEIQKNAESKSSASAPSVSKPKANNSSLAGLI